jgi:SAM-dependent methyltransferase
MQKVASQRDFSKLRILHMAPEPFFEARFRSAFAHYLSADISGQGVDRREDLTKLSFSDASFDFVYASHVLEHILEDHKALGEIRRVLAPGGIAVLPVPIVSDITVEYEAPNPEEHDHVRAPGPDYFDRYRRAFGRVDVFGSASFPEEHQLYIYEDRSCWPTPQLPNRRKMFSGASAGTASNLCAATD